MEKLHDEWVSCTRCANELPNLAFHRRALVVSAQGFADRYRSDIQRVSRTKELSKRTRNESAPDSTRMWLREVDGAGFNSAYRILRRAAHLPRQFNAPY